MIFNKGNLVQMINPRSAIKSITIAFIFIMLMACGNDSGKGKKAVYVKPSVDYKGRYRKGHVRMPVSTDKHAIKNQNRSRYYYQTRGKFRRKK
jgi:hypothetical protein